MYFFKPFLATRYFLQVQTDRQIRQDGVLIACDAIITTNAKYGYPGKCLYVYSFLSDGGRVAPVVLHEVDQLEPDVAAAAAEMYGWKDWEEQQ